MRKIVWIITVVCAFLLVLQTEALAQQTDSFDREKLDTYLNLLYEENRFMGTVAIDSAGRIEYHRSLGFLDPEEPGNNADKETMYHIGSITKTFTAVIIFQLIEEGKLTLSTRLSDFFPGLPQADMITVEHLLRHQSGLYNFTNADDYREWMTEERTKEQMLETFSGKDPLFAPGDSTAYSNTNYVLLGYIAEEISGEPYAEQLKKRITEPLGLDRTSIVAEIDPEDNEAYSLRYDEERWEQLPQTNMFIPHGAGAVASTPEDLLQFIRALFSGDLVSDETLDQMKTLNNNFGIGLFRIPFYGKVAYGHNGGIDGFQSHLSYFPAEDVALAVTANGVSYNMNNILIGVLSIYFGRDFEIPSFDEVITLSPKQMERLTGRFGSAQLPLEVEVFVKDSVLMAQATGQPSFPLTATEETVVKFDQAGLVMEFDSLANGKYQQFTLKQAGGQFLFTRE